MDQSMAARERNRQRLAQASVSSGKTSAFETKLRDASVTDAFDIPYHGGINSSEWLRTSDGTPLFYKPTTGERFESTADDGGGLVRETIHNRDFTLAEREVLAYRVDQALGTDLVPPTVLRNKIGGSPNPWSDGSSWGSAQMGADGDPFVDSGYYPKPVDMWKSVILDTVIGNTDRHAKNALVGDPDQNGEVPIIAIDHGYSFPGDSAWGNADRTGGMALNEFRHELVDRYFIGTNPNPPAALKRKLLSNLKSADWNGMVKPFKMSDSERSAFFTRIKRVTTALETDTMGGLVREVMKWAD